MLQHLLLHTAQHLLHKTLYMLLQRWMLLVHPAELARLVQHDGPSARQDAVAQQVSSAILQAQHGPAAQA
jgi:hypothetical protein